MSQPPTDILRELHGAADRAGLACTRTGNFRVAMIDAGHLRAAADEIERLRAERDEARQRVCSIAYPEQHIQELVKTINTLRAERDELRERLRRSNQALDSLAGYAAPE